MKTHVELFFMNMSFPNAYGDFFDTHKMEKKANEYVDLTNSSVWDMSITMQITPTFQFDWIWSVEVFCDANHLPC